MILAALLPAMFSSELKAQEASDSCRIKKILFIGDSMTGWMAERMNAYGDKNDFEVATLIWDGSTIGKWANSNGLDSTIASEKPDAVFISLGMNELFEPYPRKKLGDAVDRILSKMGDVPYLWVGPPSWPGHDKGEVLTDWLAEKLGPEHFFNSFNLDLPRQSKSNPHPSKKGIEIWIDKLAEWIPQNTSLSFDRLETPEPGKMSRPKTFIYKRMNDRL